MDIRIGILGLAMCLWFANPGQAGAEPALDEAYPPGPRNTINAALGDSSWEHRYGQPPDSSAKEHERIETHLTYVLELLRVRDVSHLSTVQRERRQAALEVLAAYIRRGVFPQRRGDAYPTRRPRFIDDRGTHCAVGHLIAASGQPALARAINRDYEFAYVPDIDAPALLTWAARHGFTVEELASIQPTYRPPPTKASTRRKLKQQKDRIALECAHLHEPKKKVRVQVQGGDYGRVTVTTRSKDAFSRCFAERMQPAAQGGGAMRGRAKRYRFQTWLHLKSPQKQLEQRFAQLQFKSGVGCIPRPGSLPTSASFLVQTTEKGLEVEVKTNPENTAVDECMERIVRQNLDEFRAGVWKLKLREKRSLSPAMTSDSLQQAVASQAPVVVQKCSRSYPMRDKITFRVQARLDAKAFEIEVRGLSKGYPEQLNNCFRNTLQTRLRQYFSRSWRQPNGRYRDYFRIDGDAEARHTVAPKRARKRRRK